MKLADLLSVHRNKVGALIPWRTAPSLGLNTRSSFKVGNSRSWRQPLRLLSCPTRTSKRGVVFSKPNRRWWGLCIYAEILGCPQS